MSTMLDHNTTRRLKIKKIEDNVHFPEYQSNVLPFLGKEVTVCTTVLKPDSDYEVDERVEDSLTQSHLINWCRTIHNIHPLKVTGQGNQFLCAVSMALWGFCDAANLLRRLLFVSVSEFVKDIIFERWLRMEDGAETTIEVGFKRFVAMTRCSSVAEESSSELVPDEFPHPLHIFIMANIIRRPIMIVGDENDPHTGLYLPVLSNPDVCTKWPLILAVNDGLFFPLVNKESVVTEKKLAEYAIPLVSYELLHVKLMFLLEAEESEVFALLQKYVCTTELNLTRSRDICLVLSAKLKNLPFEFTGNSSQIYNNEQTSSSLRPFPNIVPSAPSASIITLNNLSEVSPFLEETREVSMLQETCRVPGCNLFASRYTEPYCWEHVEQGSNTVHQTGSEKMGPECVEISLVNERCKEAGCPHFASRFIYPYCYEHIDKVAVERCVRAKPKDSHLPPDSSVVMEHCQHHNCRNYASQYVYPFCYEHLDDHTVRAEPAQRTPSKVNEPAISREFDMSIMAECCAHPNCNNHASKYTYPVCYEHLDSPLAITRASAATRVVQLPHAVAGQPKRLVNGNQLSGAPKPVPEFRDVDKKFEETMSELETRTRSGRLCLTTGCTHFGNSRCRGYCHSCYNSLNPF